MLNRKLSKLPFLSAVLPGVLSVVLIGGFLVPITHVVAAPATDAREKEHREVNLNNVKIEKRETGESKRASGPSVSRGEAFIVATEGKLSAEIKKTIAFYERTERTLPPKSSARLQMLERLVNLYLENAVYEANAEFRKYDASYSAWERAGRKGKSPTVNNNASKAVWKQVATKSAYVMKQFPNTKNADELMFNQGLALQYLGLDKESARVFSDLIQKYPNSDKSGEAYFQLGDFFFEKHDYRNATNNYKQALRYKTSRGFGWSLFKLGWCSYNLGNYPESLAYWKKTVDVASSSRQKGADQLKEEGLKDMVFAWVEIKQVEEAITYYRQHGGEKYIGKFLNQLGSALVDAGKFNEAVRVYKRYQQIFPNNPDTPDTQKDIISLYFDLNKFSDMWRELEAYPKMYGPASAWLAANKSDQALTDSIQVKIKDTIIYYAKVLHKSGQKDDNDGTYAEALRGYLLYLKFYPNSKEMPEVKFNMADILFVQKKYREAGRLYYEVAALGKDKAIQIIQPGNKVVSLHRDASRYMLDSYGLDFEPEYKVLLKLTPDFAKAPRPLSQRATSYVQACSEYIKWYPDDKKSVKECDIYSTAIYYRTADKEKSRKLLFNIAQKYPNEKIGPEAVEWLIPLYSGDTKSLVQIADALLKMPSYQKGKLGDKLRDLKRGAEIDEIKKIGDVAKRAKAYEDQAKKHPNSADADKLMYNAGVDYIKAGMVAAGIGAYAAVVKNYPKSEGYQESLLQLAKLSDKRLEFATAAGYYLAFASRFPKEKTALPAVGRACELQVALGDEKALNTCMMLAKSDPDGARGFIDRMVREAEYQRNYAKMQQLIAQYYLKFKLTPDERIIAFHRIYNAANGRGPAAQQASSEMLGAYRKANGKVGAEASRYVGELSFNSANTVMPRFAAMKLVGGTVDNLAASIQKKAGSIPVIDKSYNEVLNTKDAYWGVAALYQMGYARELLAYDLDNPPSITGASIEDVKKQLAPQVAAARAEAKKYYQFAVDSIGKYSVYNEWAGKSVSGLARIQGQKLSFEDVALLPDFVGSDVAAPLVQAVQSGKAGE
jgi:TolA-binding protein